MTQIECTQCGEPVMICDSEKPYDLCWLCANVIVDKLRDLVAADAGCEPDSDRPGCVAWATESCNVRKLCAILSAVDEDAS